MDLDGARVLVTGGSRGIGAALARAYAAAGAEVVVAARSEGDLRAVAEEVGGHAVVVDLSDPAAVEGLVPGVEAEIGPIDVLVNNAGVETVDMAAVIDPVDVRTATRVNLEAPMVLTRYALPGMLERNRGHIVNLSSMAGKMTVPGAAVYTASKFAVATLSRTVRAEIAHTGVTITTILPSAVETELAAGLDLRGVPKATPEEIAVEIVASCQHGKPEVTLPKWLFPVGTIEQALPEKLGNWVKRTVGAQKRISADTPQSRKYQERLSRF